MTELGKRLREAREQKGWSLDDVQQLTKIQKRYLRGIEEGNYSSMPGHFYVRAFIKQYAETVGLDADEIFEQYSDDLPQLETDQLPDLSRVRTRKVSDNTTKFFNIFPKILIAVFIIGALLLAYYFIADKNLSLPNTPVEEDNETQIKLEQREDPDGAENNAEQTDENDQSSADNNEETNDDGPTKGEQELIAVNASGRTSTYELRNSDQFVIKVTSPGQTWLEIRNGKGHTFYSGMLSANNDDGETVDMTNESEAFLVVGRATEADIFINGEKLTYEISPAEQVRQDVIIKYINNNE